MKKTIITILVTALVLTSSLSQAFTLHEMMFVAEKLSHLKKSGEQNPSPSYQSGDTSNDLGPATPNKSISPGVTNPNVTQDNIHQTICVKGYTKSIRPPMSFTNDLKVRQITEYGYTDTNPKHYEEDHVIPLSLGGAPDDPRNLFPQLTYTCSSHESECKSFSNNGKNQVLEPEFGSKQKDKLELRLMNLVCSGSVSLTEAQGAIANDWVSAYKKYGGETYHGFGSND